MHKQCLSLCRFCVCMLCLYECVHVCVCVLQKEEVELKCSWGERFHPLAICADIVCTAVVLTQVGKLAAQSERKVVGFCSCRFCCI